MSESPIDVWTSQAIPAGSGRYYALLHCNSPTQSNAILTLISIWSKLCFSNKEMDAAKKQIDWWQAELTGNNPQHPVTQQLLSAVTTPDQRSQIIKQLTEVLLGYSALVTEGSPSRADPNRLFHHRTGAVAALALAGQPDKKVHHSVETTGIALSQFRCIRHLHKHVLSGLLCLPLEEMEASNLSPKELLPGQYTDNLTHLLHSRLDTIGQQLDDALIRLPAECPDAVFLYVYGQLQATLLQKIRKDLTLLDQPDIRLSPLRNFWIARKAARRQLKLRKGEA